jgi:chromosomal replication initiation ATPase DnaA
LPEYYGYTWEEINVKTRVRPISDIKHHFIALVKETTDLSLMSIGAIFTYKENGIDHTTVLNSIKAWDNLLSYDKEKQKLHEDYKAEVKQLIALI